MSPRPVHQHKDHIQHIAGNKGDVVGDWRRGDALQHRNGLLQSHGVVRAGDDPGQHNAELRAAARA